ncbi:uncharacterized protein FA14DRAFT_162182 [Meira miltonrushii]|uniref:Uncharacterized protein n=1 Tax=Meira miltonrushii TaxID=1280837 RepID=A0A316VA09_9BASI|nr:uncharacterized protein FA14DRAFT_162182 [Meira miltonrushii]PWN33013.1 hypothetical protein FA14DRAFT_162182 [Meira miltonrushii]
MAPPSELIARGIAGPSVVRSDIQYSHNLFQKRQTDKWSIEDQISLSKVANESGQFNGTCTLAQESGLPPVTDAGECASYYADVTVYCCGAVGGMILDLSQPSQSDPSGGGQNTTSSNSTSTANSTSNGDASQLSEPACRTNNFNNMLLCYKYTAEEHCRSAVTGPWGVCNTSGATISAEQQGTQTQANGALSAANRASKMIVAGIVLSSALLLVAGETL